ncbi:MAG: HAMP domain-containing sensor histidine kinase [Candidatus Latescibacterota bacterium]|nr:HAMP domain-containing sensor histidine kinase [Candidatus Latescibacterota bacterium]
MGISKLFSRVSPILRARIGRRLIVSFVVLVLCLTFFLGGVLVKLARISLESQMNVKLKAIAQLVASGVGHDVVRLKANDGWENSGYYLGLKSRLEYAKLVTGASRIYVFNRFFGNLIDTDGTLIGQQIHHSRIRDLREVELALSGESTCSILFYSDNDIPYMTGYAPVKKGSEVVAIVGIDIGAGFVDSIHVFRRSVALFLVIGVFLTVIVAWIMALTLTRPIQKLVYAAGQIGKGDLDRTVPNLGNDELGYLAESLDEMRRGLLDRDNQLRQMLGGVAHEIRNPLGGIEIYAGLIADDLPDNDDRKHHIQKVIQEVRKLDDVISEFLSFARPSSPDFEYVSLLGLARDATFLLSPDLEKTGIEVQIDISPKTVVWVDREQIKRALFNLIKNGTQAMSQGGCLRIEGRKLGEQVLIEVSDTGDGISEDMRNKIFQPFFTTRASGSGLGLAIVSKLVQENGGYLTLHRSGPDGSAFRLYFPFVLRGS